MRDRLIKLLRESENKVQKTLKEKFSLDLSEWIGIYADYLLENGVIVPPCKVGDAVYTYNSLDHTYKLRESTVRAIKIQKNNITGVQEFLIEYFYTDNLFSWSDQGIFGKNVFLTKEEAERALKGAEGK